MSFNQLKINDIEKIYQKVYYNACELIDDAELLFKHNRFARSYLAAQIAFEELGKLPMLYTVALKLHNGEKINWKEMSSRLRNHKIKTSTSFLLVMIFEKSFIKLEEDKEQYEESDKFIMPVDIDSFKEIINSDTFLVDLGRTFRAFKESDIQEDYLLRQSLADYMNDFKNHSLYADFKEAEFLKPSEIIDEEKCRKRLKTVLLQKKVSELNSFHINGFRLFKFDDGYFKLKKEMIDGKFDRLKK